MKHFWIWIFYLGNQEAESIRLAQTFLSIKEEIWRYYRKLAVLKLWQTPKVFLCCYGVECSSMSLNPSGSPCMFYCFCGNTRGGRGVGGEEGRQ